MQRLPIIVFLVFSLLLALSIPPASAEETIRVLFNNNAIMTEETELTDIFGEFIRAMRECGATIDRASIRHLTDELLADYDILIMIVPQMKLADADKEALRRFIAAGGGVLFMVEPYELGFDTDNINSFTRDYGIQSGSVFLSFFEFGEVIQTSPLAVPEKAEHVFMGIFSAGLEVTPGESEAAIVDKATGSVLAAYSIKQSILGKGRLVVFGDYFPFFDVLIRERDGLAMGRNLIRYLASDPEVADLAITRMTIKAKGLFPGDIVNVSFTVKNTGDAATGDCSYALTLHAWDKEHKTAGPSLKKLRELPLGVLQAGEEKVFTTHGKLPGDLEPGVYVVKVVVDPKNVSGDKNRENNSRIGKTFTVH